MCFQLVNPLHIFVRWWIPTLPQALGALGCLPSWKDAPWQAHGTYSPTHSHRSVLLPRLATCSSELSEWKVTRSSFLFPGEVFHSGRERTIFKDIRCSKTRALVCRPPSEHWLTQGEKEACPKTGRAELLWTFLAASGGKLRDAQVWDGTV